MPSESTQRYFKWKECMKKMRGIRILFNLNTDESWDRNVCSPEFKKYKEACAKSSK